MIPIAPLPRKAQWASCSPCHCHVLSGIGKQQASFSTGVKQHHSLMAKAKPTCWSEGFGLVKPKGLENSC